MHRHRFEGITLCLLAIGLLVSSAARAQEAQADPYKAVGKLSSQGKTITIQLEDADMKEALDALAEATGIELRIEGDLPDNRYPVELKDTTVSKALIAIGRRGRLRYEVPDPNTLVVTARPRASRPMLIDSSYVAARYPKEARERDLEGTVMIRARVLTDGTVGEVTVAQNESGFQPFEDSAVAAVKQWRFEPAIREGKPVEVFVHLPVEFRLGNEP